MDAANIKTFHSSVQSSVQSIDRSNDIEARNKFPDCQINADQVFSFCFGGVFVSVVNRSYIVSWPQQRQKARELLAEKFCTEGKRYCSLKQAEEHVLGRVALDHVLEQNAIQLQISKPWVVKKSNKNGEVGKPLLESQFVNISISHRADWAAACASRDFKTGVDIEEATLPPSGFSDWILNQEERVQYQIGDVSDSLVLRVYWVAKEAVLKALGIGLVAGPQSITLALPSEIHSPFILDGADSAIDGTFDGKVFEAHGFGVSFDCHFRVFGAEGKKMILCVAQGKA